MNQWIECSTQTEFDAAITNGDVPIVRSGYWEAYGSSTVTAYGSSTVTAYGSSTVRAFDSSTVTAYGSSTVRASGSSTVTAFGSSTVRAFDSSTVTASGSSTVRASGSSTVRAFGSSTVTASGSSTVRAFDSSTVTAYGSSTVTAYGSSTVTAYDSSTVTASGSSTVRAYGSSTVRAFGSSTVTAGTLVPVHDHGPSVKITGGIPISVRHITNPKAWCEFHGLTVERGKVTVFKAVEADWRGGTKRDGITYAPGDKPEAPDWAKNGSCGEGLHFVARPWEGDRYLNDAPAHYVACVVRVSEMAVIDQGKVKCRRVVAPITECDIDGEPLPVTGAGE